MKKFLIAVALGTVLVLALATTVTADNGPHGGFNGSTDACASCHRAHSAVGTTFLLTAANVYDLCTACHDGTGAYTNVVDGYYDTTIPNPDTHGKATWAGGWGEAGEGLFGGGFLYTRMLTNYGNGSNEVANGLADPTKNAAADYNTSTVSWARMNAYDPTTAASVASARRVTSTHNVEGLPVWNGTGYTIADGSGTVWGSGTFQTTVTVSPFGAVVWPVTVVNGTTAETHALECTSCHDPHGNAGRQGGLATGAAYPSYRLLRYAPEGSQGYATVSATTPAYEGPSVGSGTSFTWNTAVVPTTAGVLVPDAGSPHWYTVNSNINLDGTLAVYRGGVNGTEMAYAVFAGRGDYGGRYWAYRRPAATITAATSGTILGCKNGSGNLTVPGTACGATTGTAFDNTASQDKLGFWCGTCHDRYVAQGSATRTTDTTDPGYHYRHRAAGNGTTTGQYTCVSCHNAHGTSATASTLASNASWAKGSVLLKGDNRAICVRCHATAINFFNVTTSPTATMQYLVYP